MDAAYQVIETPNGHFRAERKLTRGEETQYRSVTFSARLDAEKWIAAQGAPTPTPAEHFYAITRTETDTLRVSLCRGGAAQVLGEFDTLAEADFFVRRMRQYDAETTDRTEA